MSAGEIYHRQSPEGWFLAKGPPNDAPLSARVNGVFSLILLNVAIQGKIIEEMKTTPSVMFGSRGPQK